MPDQVPEEIRQRRLDQLMSLQNRISLQNNLKRVGTEEKVLVTDLNDEGMALGRSRLEAPETDGEILFSCGDRKPEIGSFVQVRINRAETYDLMGEMI
jgi:ribosomal protein S12 methylthiotransferase